MCCPLLCSFPFLLNQHATLFASNIFFFFFCISLKVSWEFRWSWLFCGSQAVVKKKSLLWSKSWSFPFSLLPLKQGWGFYKSTCTGKIQIYFLFSDLILHVNLPDFLINSNFHFLDWTDSLLHSERFHRFAPFLKLWCWRTVQLWFYTS